MLRIGLQLIGCPSHSRAEHNNVKIRFRHNRFPDGSGCLQTLYRHLRRPKPRPEQFIVSICCMVHDGLHMQSFLPWSGLVGEWLHVSRQMEKVEG